MQTIRHFFGSTPVGLLMVVWLIGGCTSDSVSAPPATPSAAETVEIQVAETTTAAATELPAKILYGELPGQYGWLDLPSTAPPAEGHPVVILVHGGFWSEPWDYTLMSPLATDLVDRGYATWNIEFRRLGGFGGYPETFDDASAAIDALADIAAGQSPNLDLDRTILVGHSSGGHLALWALGRGDAAVQPVAAIGLGAIADLDAFTQSQRLLGGDRATVPERYEYAAPELDPARVVLIHGANDTIVPRSSLAKAEAVGTPIMHVADIDHFDLIDPTSHAWATTIQIIEENL